MLRRFCHRLNIAVTGTAGFWLAPALLGLATGAVVWTIWYLTKLPCTLANAVAYQCNPSTIANFIDVDVLSRCITLSAIVATLAGGLNIYMFAKEREARIAAETQLVEERKSKDELLEEFREESKAERRRSDERLSEERLRADEWLSEERRRSDETQQVLLATITDLTSKIAELAERNTGNGPPNEP